MTPEQRVRLVAASPLFSARWWSWTTGGEHASVEDAAADYVRRTSRGRRAHAPHPLFSRRWLATHGAPTPQGEDPLSWWLREQADAVACHPLLEPGVPEVAPDLVDRVLDLLASPPPVPARPGSVLLAADGDSVAVLEQVRALRGLPLVVTLDDASPEVRGALAACAVLDPSILLTTQPLADPLSAGDPVLVVASGVRDVDPALVRGLLEQAPAVPVVLDDAGLVVSPASHAGRHPRDLRDLAAYPAQDAAPVRARRRGGGEPVVVPGLAVHVPGATATGSPRLGRADAGAGLRWTIDTAVVWANRERWGDWHFAASLADALERAGQHVAVEGREARARTARDSSDVVLAIRGLDPVRPTPGAVNLLWVISHPDLLTREEAAAFDGVFAASTTWAAARSEDWGLPVEPLLQCTDATRFRPGATAGEEVLFVGNARDAERPVLRWAREAGLEVAVHGAGWRDRLPAGWWRSRGLPNAELSAAYGAAGVVLNDHHADMRAEGFVSNRLFDVVASGGLAVTDPVAGAAGLFGDSVREADGPRALLDAVRRPWPDAAARRAAAERVRREHSFDARARTLLAAARALR